MNELSNTNPNSIATLDRLTQEARMYSEVHAMNAFNLGRVFTEARSLLPHGEWLNWIRENTGMSETYVRDSMRIYRRFSNKPSLLAVEKSKLFKLLALPEGKEDDFLEDNDITNMSVREVGDAVKKARAEEQVKAELAVKKARQEARAEAEAEAAARILEAEQRAEAAEERAGDAQHFIDLARREAIERAKAERAKKDIEIQMEQQRQQFNIDMLDQQQAYDQLNQDYLDLKTQQQRGGADREPTEDLSIGVFTSAVREFMGLCARMPYMGRTFDAMDARERERYDEQLRTVEGWAAGARRAMNTYVLEGGVEVE